MDDLLASIRKIMADERADELSSLNAPERGSRRGASPRVGTDDPMMRMERAMKKAFDPHLEAARDALFVAGGRGPEAPPVFAQDDVDEQSLNAAPAPQRAPREPDDGRESSARIVPTRGPRLEDPSARTADRWGPQVLAEPDLIEDNFQDFAEPEAAYAGSREPRYEEPQYAEPEYAEAEYDETEYDEPEYDDAEYEELEADGEADAYEVQEDGADEAPAEPETLAEAADDAVADEDPEWLDATVDNDAEISADNDDDVGIDEPEGDHAHAMNAQPMDAQHDEPAPAPEEPAEPVVAEAEPPEAAATAPMPRAPAEADAGADALRDETARRCEAAIAEAFGREEPAEADSAAPRPLAALKSRLEARAQSRPDTAAVDNAARRSALWDASRMVRPSDRAGRTWPSRTQPPASEPPAPGASRFEYHTQQREERPVRESRLRLTPEEPRAPAFAEAALWAAQPARSVYTQASPDPAWTEAGAAPAPHTATPEESLISRDTRRAVSDSFEELSRTVLNTNPRTFEDLLTDMMRPMLREWLDTHLPSIVERHVRAEIERVMRHGR